MKCPYCGQEHPDWAKYCTITGQDLPGESANAADPDNSTNPAPHEPETEINPFAPRKNNPVFIMAVIVGIFLLIGGGVLVALRFLPNAGQAVRPAGPTASLPTQSGGAGAVPTAAPAQPATEPAVPAPTDLPLPVPSDTPFASASSWQQGRLVFPQRSGRLNALYQLDLSASGAPTLLYDPGGSLLLTAPAFSPDGEQAAFTFYQGDLVVLDATGGAARRLAACGAPSWSPDGSQVICTRSGQPAFFILDAQSGDVVQQISAPNQARFPTWSPAGGEIAYVTIEQGQTSIWRLALSNGAQPVLLAGSASENYAPSWSPDGQWIAFQSNLDSANSEIWLMDREGGNLHQVTDTPAGYWSRAPSYSPDGNWLAFVSDQAGSVGADYGEVFVVSLENGEVRQITQTGGAVYDWRVSWGK